MLPRGGVVRDENRQLDDLPKDHLRVKVHVEDHRKNPGVVRSVMQSTEVGQIVPLYTEKVANRADFVAEQRLAPQKHLVPNVSV